MDKRENREDKEKGRILNEKRVLFFVVLFFFREKFKKLVRNRRMKKFLVVKKTENWKDEKIVMMFVDVKLENGWHGEEKVK